jgi:hypothetical protein
LVQQAIYIHFSPLFSFFSFWSFCPNIFFIYILLKGNIKANLREKINDFENDALKAKRVEFFF